MKHGSSSASTNSTLSTSDIQNIVERLRSERCRDSMRKTYFTIWRLFNKFFLRLDYKPETWEDRIVLFIGFLVEEKLKSSTIKTYLSAIRAVLWENKINLAEDKFLLLSLIRAGRLKNDKIIMHLPIHKDLVRMIMRTVDKHWLVENSQPYLNRLYKAILMSAYFGLLRVGEVTQSPHVVLAKDVHIGINKNKVLFLLKTSKTHAKGNKPQRIKISSSPHGGIKHGDEVYCPFSTLKEYIRV